MRPVSIRFKCFGPYVEEQLIRFSELNHLFTISGETGSGKTTILDAMCYALYGSSSSGERGDFTAMRCQQAREKDETLVEFIFEEGEKVYRFGRSIAWARSKYAESYFCDLKTDGGWLPLAAKINKTTVPVLTESILHLNATQFRQIIILPQGKFESFLVSDSKDKEAVLESIFETSRWGDAARKVSEAVQKREVDLKLREMHLTELLRRYDCTTEEELGFAQNAVETALQNTETERQSKQRESTEIQTELESALKDAALFHELDTRRSALQRLEQQREYWAEEESRLNRVDAAQRISAVYDRFTAAEKADRAAESDLTSARQMHCIAEAHFKEALQNKQTHTLGETEQSKRIERKALLENARPVYAAIEGYRESFAKAGYEAKLAEKSACSAELSAFQSEERRNNALRAYEEVTRKYSETLSGYRKGIAGELAAGLHDNEPCPVCGSCRHPSPAVCDADHVSKDRLEELERECSAKQKAWKLEEETLSEARKTLERKKAASARANAVLAAASAELVAAENNLMDGIESAKNLEQEITMLEGKIGLFLREKASLEDAATKASAEEKSTADSLKRAEAIRAEARMQYENADSVWMRTLSESVFDDEASFLSCRMDQPQRDELKAKLTEYRVGYQHAAEHLLEQELLCKERERPDVTAIKVRQSEAADRVNMLNREYDRLCERLNAMKKDHAEYESFLPKLREERVKLDNDTVFANRLVGYKGKGVSITRYVLGIMMTMILRQANSFLTNIYGGRYRLHKTGTDAQNRASGLELEVEDLQTGDHRGVSSLSGGEKFLVSLSLAIGLSAVVQMQGKGVHMDAMFVDEGFGSLGASAVEDAISILVQARGGDGIVGVITHVEQIVKSIGNGVEAVKGANGNTLRPFQSIGAS